MAKEKKTIKKSTFTVFKWRDLSPSPIIGVDEVGRGCLAGRVYAAAVILQNDDRITHYTDSKLLSADRRLELSKHILENHLVGIAFATAEEIDQINILRASLLAMKRAVHALKIKGGHIVVDGTFPVPDMGGFTQTTLIKGDLRCSPVAAASIVAKVTRDQYMEDLAIEYPQYDFANHKGYSTKSHMEKIAIHGPTPEHRKTFRGVREYVVAAEL